MSRHHPKLAPLLLSALSLAGCPTGELVPHPECAEGHVLVGQGAGQHCAPADAGGDAAVDAAAGDGGADAGGDSGTATDAGTDAALPCEERCGAPSICEGDQCVRCALDPEAAFDRGCDVGLAHCDVDADPRVCRECLASSDCPDPLRARCDQGACVPCQGAGDCAGQGARDRCDVGACVECTVATEAVDCGANSCDPATRSCTATGRGSRIACESCRADSECEGQHHCMPMEWRGAARANMYCLPDRGAGCGRVFSSSYDGQTSASGTAVDVCAPDQDLTTCEAVRDMLDATDCADASVCGDDAIADDGACDSPFCSIECGTNADCPLGQTCNSICER